MVEESKVSKIRQMIIDEIKQIDPFDDAERKCIKESIQWLENTDAIFRIKYPNDPGKHLVTGYIIYDQTNKKFLLLRHLNAQQWLPGGGHVEVNEHPKDAVIRELKEELNLKADFIVERPVYLSTIETVNENSPHIDVVLFYLLHGDMNKPIKYDRKEFEEYKWFGIDDMPYEKSAPNLKKFMEKFKAIEKGRQGW